MCAIALPPTTHQWSPQITGHGEEEKIRKGGGGGGPLMMDPDIKKNRVNLMPLLIL